MAGVENPYWQVFTAQTYLQTEAAIDPSSLTRWRKRFVAAGVEELLAVTLDVSVRCQTLKPDSVIVDTHAKQFKHMSGALRVLRGRVLRDIDRQKSTCGSITPSEMMFELCAGKKLQVLLDEEGK